MTAADSTHNNAQHPLPAALLAYACGLYPVEADIELLIDHATFLHRNDFITRFVHLGTNIVGNVELAEIDWPSAITALDTGELPCSGGENRLLRLAASLADGLPVSLRDAITGIDQRNVTLLIKAVLHASEQRPSRQIN
jgi:hypothetical protein